MPRCLLCMAVQMVIAEPTQSRPGMTVSNSNGFPFGLLLTLRAGDNALFLPRHLRHDFLALVFRHIADERFIRLFQFWIAIDAIHQTVTHSLLPFNLTHFVQDNGAFQPFAWHSLKVSPMFRVLFDVGVNLRLHFGIRPVGGRLLWRIRAGCAIRCGFGFRAHNEVCVCCESPA